MEQLEQLLSQYIPAEFDFWAFAKFLLIAGAGCAILGVLLRLLCGKRSKINEAVSSAIGILMVYVVSIAVLILGSPYDQFLSPLPFVSFGREYLSIFPLGDAEFTAVCTELVELTMLSFLVNLIDHFIPKGQKFISWLLLRCLAVALAFLGQWALSWVFTAILPNVLLVYAPMILLGLLVLLLAVSVFKLVIGVLLGATLGPVVGAIYTFFFSNIVGKQIVKAALTTAILTGLVALLNRFGYVLIALSSTALMGFLPAVAILLVVWFLLYKLL